MSECLLGARSVWQANSTRDKSVSCGATARRIEKECVLRELGAATEVFDTGGVLHYTVGGVTVSGDHNNIFSHGCRSWAQRL